MIAARRLIRARGCPAETLPDLVAAGQVALWEVSTRYDSGRAAFWTYAERRVRGAMFDELRSRDHLRQQGRRHVREHGATRCPWLLAVPVPLEVAHHVRAGDDPEADVADREVVRLVLSLAVEMGGRYVDVVRMYYLEGMRQGEIAARLGLSEGRVSQIRKEAVRELAARCEQYV